MYEVERIYLRYSNCKTTGDVAKYNPFSQEIVPDKQILKKTSY